VLKDYKDFGIEIRGSATGEVYTTCPECSHTRKKRKAKCLSVNTDKQVWVCHHCGWKGSLKEGADKSRIIHWAKPRYIKPQEKPKADLPDNVIEWFGNRGITQDVIIRNKIGYSSVYMPQVEDFVNAIYFPYYRDGQLINRKYRDGKKHFRMEAGAERVLYGLDDIEDVLIIVEGEMDKLSFDVAGATSCVSVPDGAPMPETKDYSSKFDFLESAAEKLESVEKFLIAVDNDEAGIRLEEELIRRLGKERCLKVKFPDGCKDANETLINYGIEILQECLATASPYPINGVFNPDSVMDRIVNLYDKGWEKGVSTGWSSLNEFYTVRPGEFTVVTGMPNSGKSNWLDCLTVNLAKEQGWSFAIFSPENQPVEDHMARMMEKYAEIPFGEGITKRMTEKERDDSARWVAQHYEWILPEDDADWSLETILDVAKQLVYRKGIRGLIIDPWNEIEHMRPNNLSETEYISQALKKIRQFGRYHNIHIWIVAHPSKLYRETNGNYPVPTLYDISGSAHWRNKADNGVIVYRDFSQENDQVEIHVQKIRFRQIGKLGADVLTYKRTTATYMELSEHGREMYWSDK